VKLHYVDIVGAEVMADIVTARDCVTEHDEDVGRPGVDHRQQLFYRNKL